MKQTTEYAIIAEAKVSGKTIKKTFPGYSSTKVFSNELLLDLAEEEFRKLYSSGTIEIISVSMESVTISE